MEAAEVDFPRGGVEEFKKTLPQKLKKRIKPDFSKPTSHLKKQKQLLVAEESISKNDEIDGVWKRTMTHVFLTEGLLGLGIVREIFDLEIHLETADGTVVSLPASNISHKLFETLKNTPVVLQDLFLVGQMVAFRVVTPVDSLPVKKKSSIGKRYAIVSCVPSFVNSHLSVSNIANGLVLNGAIESVEEKGAVIDLGFRSAAKGFLPFSELPAEYSPKTLVPGQVLLFRIHQDSDLKKTRVIRLSGVPEAKNLDENSVSILKMNMLMPGTVLNATPIKPSSNGFYVDLGNGVKSHLANRHLPPNLRKNISRFIKPIRCVVAFCQQNSQILVLCAHPDVVAVSHSKRKTAFNGIQIGDTITCIVSSRDKKGSVFFEVPSDETNPRVMFTIFGAKNLLESENYEVGSEHFVRVVGYKYFQRQLLVTTKRKVLLQKFISIKDAAPGITVNATIESIKGAGIYVRIYGSIPGFIPLIHLADKILRKPDKHFASGQILKCRVLYTDHARSRVVLTRRPSFLSSKEKVISDYSSDNVGISAPGVISSIQANGALVVSFYGNIAAYMPQREASRIHNVKVGSPVHVTVLNVEPDNGRMLVGVSNVSKTASSAGAHSERVISKESADVQHLSSHSKCIKSEESIVSKVKIKLFMILTAKVVGLWTKGTKSDCAVELELPGGDIGRLHGCELDEESLNASPLPVKKFVDDRKNRKVRVKVIGFSKVKVQPLETPKLSKAIKVRPSKGPKVVRIAECTMHPQKLGETRKKLTLLGYKQAYTQGEYIPVFVKEGSHFSGVHVEVSPLWNGVIEKQNLGENDLKVNITDKKSALIDIDVEAGQVLKARVIGVNETGRISSKRKRKKCLKLSLAEFPKVFKEGQKVTGRVITLTKFPTSVTFELSNGQRAVLTPTGVTGRYHHSLERLRSFNDNEVYYLYLLRFYEKGGYWFAVTENRYKNRRVDAKKRGYNKLLLTIQDVQENDLLKGFVGRIANGIAFAELGPGILGRIMKRESGTELALDQLITVRVLKVFDDGGFNLLFMGAVTKATDTDSSVGSQEVSRKRLVSNSYDLSIETPQKKSKLAGFKGSSVQNPAEPAPVSVTIQDPGFDWSLKGFTAADFAAVGKIGKNLEVGVNETSVSKSVGSEKDVSQEVQKEKEGESEMKSLTQQEITLLKEKELFRQENALMEIHENPTSENHFDLLVTGSPNSSELWTRYMAFFISKQDIGQARAIAERALGVINFREEEEIFNMWSAYLNLESVYGTPTSLKNLFERAIKNADSLKMHKQMFRIYQKAGKVEENDELLNGMLKKFRHEDLEVWTLYGQHLMDTGRADKARELLKKAMKSLQAKHHVTLLCRFAQMEFKSGDPEQGKTIFESILNSYPKKTDVWVVYIDSIAKMGTAEETRQLFERATSLKLSTHKMRQFFKKWMTFEEKHGSENTQKMVKQKAAQYVDDFIKEING